MNLQAVRVSCDSLAVLADRTASGRTIFAKNSDRPSGECQPLFAAPAARPKSDRLRCTYIEIDQVAETYALVGARPYWLWGLEHGVNEKGVAIGNHTIFTRDAVADTGLVGMDLVRLGLERAGSAEAAAEILIELIERYGQGGSGYSDTHWPYHNSFLIADSKAALLLEASSSRWALKRADSGALSASNHTTIAEDWDLLGHDTIEHAIAREWWPEPTGVRFDFARAYRSIDVAPPVLSSGRYATTCRAADGGGFDVAAMQRVMRDHYESGDVHLPGRTPDDERYFSVCMHADPVGSTTASMVVELAPGNARPLVAWMAFSNPCVAPYLPVFVGARAPEELIAGTADASSGGAWYRFKALLREVEKNFERRAAYVRAFWNDFEQAVLSDTDSLVASLPDDAAARRSAEEEHMASTWTRASDALASLTERVGAL